MNRIAAEYLYTGTRPEPLRNGYVEYTEDGTIVSAGVCRDPASEQDFRKGALMPGFVNSHCHLELSHLKGKFRKGTGMSGFINQINELRDFTSAENRMAEAARWLDILWRQGVSAMADISNCDETFMMKSASPLYTRTFLEVFGTEPEDCGQVIASVRNLAEKAASYGIDAAPPPSRVLYHEPGTSYGSLSRRSGCRVSLLSFGRELRGRRADGERTGPLAENYRGRNLSTPPVTGRQSLFYFIDRLLKVHQPPFDEHILLVHNVCLTQEGIDYASGYLKNVWWAVCPLSNIFIHNSLPPIPLMRKNGLGITVGTDSLSSNDTLDMVREMYCLQQAFPEVPLGEIVVWATRNGACFLSKQEELGSFTEGLRPGIVWVKDIAPDGRLTVDSVSERII